MVSALAALANVHRLRVFRSLVFAGPAGLSAGLVQAQAEGKFLVCRPKFAQARALVDYLLAHRCEGTGTGTGADCKTC